VTVVTRKTMFAAAVAAGVVATGVGYWGEAVSPGAQSNMTATPVVASIPKPGAFATPNPLLEAVMTGAPAPLTGVVSQSAGGD
jgi:hypothetical protein